MEHAAHNGQSGAESLLVRRLIEQGVRDPRVLAAFARVPREKFVPADKRGEAEADRALEIGQGQTISQPYVVARMSEALELTGKEQVLEIGTGSGYQTAILCEMLELRPDGSPSVRSIEILPELSAGAGRVLAELGYGNVELAVGDGARGWPAAAPFDAIVVTAAPREVPQALVDQLAIGGRLCIPVGPTGQQQELELWRKTEAGTVERRRLFSVRFVPLVGHELL